MGPLEDPKHPYRRASIAGQATPDWNPVTRWNIPSQVCRGSRTPGAFPGLAEFGLATSAPVLFTPAHPLVTGGPSLWLPTATDKTLNQQVGWRAGRRRADDQGPARGFAQTSGPGWSSWPGACQRADHCAIRLLPICRVAGS
jgi:hypothetical protein